MNAKEVITLRGIKLVSLGDGEWSVAWHSDLVTLLRAGLVKHVGIWSGGECVDMTDAGQKERDQGETNTTQGVTS